MNPYEENVEPVLLETDENENEEDNSEFIEEDASEEEEVEDEIPTNTIFDEAPVVKPVSKPKRVLSDEHKAKLQAGRLRALENRRENARKKKEMKQLKKKKEEVEYDNLVNEVDDLEHYKPKHKIGHYVLSEDDLIKLQEKAVESYDNKRKERKKEKQAKKHQESLKGLINQTRTNVENAWEMYLPQ